MRRQLTISPTSKPLSSPRSSDDHTQSIGGSPPSSPETVITTSTSEISPLEDPGLNFPPRYSLASPFKPISYPYTSNTTSLGYKLRSTLRPRRRSSLIRLAQRRFLHIVLAGLIPFFILLIFNEWAIHSHRRSEAIKIPSLFHPVSSVNLHKLRSDWEIRRRQGIAAARSGTQRAVASRADKRDLVEGLQGMRGIPWTLEEEVELQKEVGDIWPGWWGNVDKVGRSPYDHLPSIKGKRRILFLTDYKDYLERMNTHTYEIVDAALRHPNVIVDVWGPGWKGYDKAIPLSLNLKRRQYRIHQLEKSKEDYELAVSRKKGGGRWFGEQQEQDVGEWVEPEWTCTDEENECGEVKFDIVWTISDIFKQNDPHVDVLDCGSLLVQQLGDCHSWRCRQEWYYQANNITLSKYAFELPEIFDHSLVKQKFPDWEMGLFGHSPDTANEWDFYPTTWRNKTTDATMFGYDGSFYPIRTTVTDYTRDDEHATIHRHEHPGYTISVPELAWSSPLETYTKSHEYYEKHALLREDFAKGMREAKICVFDASLERKMIRKYAQALLSGCVIAGDLPTEHEEALEKFTIKLKPTWKIDRIKEEIDKYLAQPAKLHQMAVDGLIYARQHLTATRKVSDLIRMADAYNAGMRGYDSFLCDVGRTGVTVILTDHRGAAEKEDIGDWRDR